MTKTEQGRLQAEFVQWHAELLAKTQEATELKM